LHFHNTACVISGMFTVTLASLSTHGPRLRSRLIPSELRRGLAEAAICRAAAKADTEAPTFARADVIE